MPSGREFVEVFEDVWKYILGSDKVLQLSDTVCISRNKKLYRPRLRMLRFLISNSKKPK